MESTANKYVSWQPEYSVGKDKIDIQHKKLFLMINELQNSIEHSEAGIQSVEKSLEELISYAEHHFTTEEKYFRNQDGFDSHHHEHWAFIKQSFAYVKRFNEERDPAIITDIADFLRSWLVNHILDVDIKQFRQISCA